MRLKITDLQPGDRVILNCPEALRSKREAIFERIHSFDRDLTCAVFLMQTIEHPVTQMELQLQLRALFLIEPDRDGTIMRDDEGRAIYVEQRVFARKG